MIDYTAVHLALRGQLLTTVGVGTDQAWENMRYAPVQGVPFLRESFVPATSTQLTTYHPSAIIEHTGLYILSWNGDNGSGIAAIRTVVAAILAKFTPGTSLAVSNGDTVYVRSRPGPWAGQLIPMDDNFTRCTITIPWLVRSANAVAA